MIKKLCFKTLGAGNQFFDWLAQPGTSGPLLSFCRMSLFLYPPMRGLYLYRMGQLNDALFWFNRFKSRNSFLARIRDRVQHMVNVLNTGWKFEQKMSSSKTGGNAVVMALHNSLPHDGAGYAVRSHQLLRHLHQLGVHVFAYTRPGYPTDLRKHSGLNAAASDLVDDIVYSRSSSRDANIGSVEAEYVSAYADLLVAAADRHHAGVIHAASNYLDGLSAVSAARSSGRRSIYEVRGLWHLSRAIREPSYAGSDHYRYSHICELAAANAADAVVTISESLKQELVREGVSEDKITLIPNSVDTQRFRPATQDQELRHQLGIDNETTVVGFIGSLTDYEGVDLILQAVSTLHRKGYKICAVIVGKGYAQAQLEALWKSLPNPNCVHFVGFVPHSEVTRYYSVMEILPFPRKNMEVCRLVPPLKILEAMAMEKKVIVSALPPLQEMVKDNETGLVCEPDNCEDLAEKLVKFIEAPDMATELAVAAREWVRDNRDWSQVSKTLFDLYRKLQK